MSVVNFVSAQIEKVAEKYPIYVATKLSPLAKKLGKADKVEISRRLYRIPVLQYYGGALSKVNLDGGAWPAGTTPKFTHLSAGYIASLRAYKITQESMNTTSGGKAVADAFKVSFKRSLEDARFDFDISLYGDGTGVLTGGASAGSGASFTFASSTDFIGLNRLREGMTVDVWDSALTTNRTSSGSVQITAIDWVNKIVTVSASVSGAAPGDYFTVAGLAAYGPAGPTSFSATWPGDGLTNAAGLTGDSWRHGIRYANDATTSRYYLGVQKSALPQLLPSVVTASAQVTEAHIQLVKDGIVQKRDEEALNGLEGFCHMAQMQQIRQLVVPIRDWRAGGSMPDIQPNSSYTDTVTVSGITFNQSKMCDKDRIDFVNPKLWFRAESMPEGFAKDPMSNSYIHPMYDGSGNKLFSYQWGVVSSFDIGTYDPGVGGAVVAATVPTGY
jgi:hypothetical protein